jgi:NADPH-dependent curcumin reductase CurA
MSQRTYQSAVLASRPKTDIVPGETFALKNNPIITASDLKDGQELVESVYLSLDPTMRGWLNEGQPMALFDDRN